MAKPHLLVKIAFIVLAFVLLAIPSPVLADVAPPANPPGSNLQPDSETTQVRMVAETVQIDVKATDNLGSARVTADFSMRNLGEASESMAVRFPISAEDGFGNYPEITDLAIKVDGKPVSFQRVKYPDTRYQSTDVPWAEFSVTFPTGQDVPIQVAYNLKGSGYMPFTAFYYILETGAGWKDTIGSADIILRLPYPASQQNVITNLQIGWAETTPGGVIQGNEVRWHFDNFEPGPYGPVQNMEFALVAPEIWRNVLKARAAAEKNPADSEAWGQLAKSYKGIFLMSKSYRTDPGGEEIYALSVAAYEKCLALNPKDAQWHAGFADLLANRAYWDSWFRDPSADAYRALAEIQTALQLAPNDAKVLEIADVIHGTFPDGMTKTEMGYDFPWLTATPTRIPPTPTIVPVLDPAQVSGTYQSETLLLADNKKARLSLTLGLDHSAKLETIYEGEAAAATGLWTDNGDGTLSIEVTDGNQKKTQIKFVFKTDLLQGNEYPSYYGDAGIYLQRLVSAMPVPATETGVAEAATPVPAQPATPTIPASKSSLPICGSAALPLIGVLWLTRKRR